MNNISNMIAPGQAQPSAQSMSLPTNTSIEGLSGVASASSSSRSASFDESLKKASVQSIQPAAKIDVKDDGKILPPVAESGELPAEDDRPLAQAVITTSVDSSGEVISAEQNTNGGLQIVSTQAMEEAGSNKISINEFRLDESGNDETGIDEVSVTAVAGEKESVLTMTSTDGADVGSKLSLLLSQVRQQQRIEQKTAAETSAIAQTRTASGELKTGEGTAVTTALPGAETETAKLSTDVLQPIAEKANSFAMPPDKQILAALQTSAQNPSSPVEPLSDSSPLVTNTLTNNLSSSNLASVPQAEITEAFGRPAWSQGMGKQILWMANQNISSAEIRLNPAHLGPIEILIDMSDDQVNVSLSSRHAIVREAMEQALPKLREMLSENGFSLADADISQHSFAEQREQHTAKTSTRVSSSASKQSSAADLSGHAIATKISSPLGMVDYYI